MRGPHICRRVGGIPVQQSHRRTRKTAMVGREMVTIVLYRKQIRPNRYG